MLGILFDVKNHYGDPEGDDMFRWKYIDPLFDSMQLKKQNAKPSAVPIGKLLNALKNYPRFTYRGSLTTPPCSETLNWNVINYVFPITQKHLDQFRNQLKWQTDTSKYRLDVTGNYRVINAINEHEPMIVLQPGGVVNDEKPGNAPYVVTIVFAVLAAIFLLATFGFHLQYLNAVAEEAASKDEESGLP